MVLFEREKSYLREEKEKIKNQKKLVQSERLEWDQGVIEHEQEKEKELGLGLKQVLARKMGSRKTLITLRSLEKSPLKKKKKKKRNCKKGEGMARIEEVMGLVLEGEDC